MKKLLFSIFCVCISIDAFALPTASQRQSACDGVFVKGICVPTNPCESTNEEIKSAYCDERFAFFAPRTDQDALWLVGLFADESMKTMLTDKKYIDSDKRYVAVTTIDGDYKVFEFDFWSPGWVRQKYFIAAVGIAMGEDCWYAISGDNNIAYCNVPLWSRCEEIQGLITDLYGEQPYLIQSDGRCKYTYPEE